MQALGVCRYRMLSMNFIPPKPILVFSAVILLSCQYNVVRLSVNGNNPPTFKVNGIDMMVYFSIEEINHQTQQRVGEYPLWGFDKKSEVPSLPMMWRLPAFAYGRLPTSDYQQIYPSGSKPPIPLEEGKMYKAEVHTDIKDIGVIIFEIKNGQVSVNQVKYW